MPVLPNIPKPTPAACLLFPESCTVVCLSCLLKETLLTPAPQARACSCLAPCQYKQGSSASCPFSPQCPTALDHILNTDIGLSLRFLAQYGECLIFRVCTLVSSLLRCAEYSEGGGVQRRCLVQGAGEASALGMFCPRKCSHVLDLAGLCNFLGLLGTSPPLWLTLITLQISSWMSPPIKAFPDPPV